MFVLILGIWNLDIDIDIRCNSFMFCVDKGVFGFELTTFELKVLQLQLPLLL